MDLQSALATLADIPWLMTALDLVGVFFFATSGALLASRKRFDVVGSTLLSVLAGLGGGITRDVLLGRGLPASLEHPLYLVPPLLASLLVYLKVIHPDRLNRTITVFDAGGLALFTVTGVMLLHGLGVNPVATVIVATIGAVGGGVLRDIVANEVPAIFDPRGVYAVPALLGAAVATAVALNGALNAVTGTLIAALVFGLRMAGYRYGWRVPGADISQDMDSLARLRRLAVQAQATAAARARGAARGAGEADAADGVSVRQYDPVTQEITVVDTATHQTVHLDPGTGTMDVTDLRTGRTRSYDDPGPAAGEPDGPSPRPGRGDRA